MELFSNFIFDFTSNSSAINILDCVFKKVVVEGCVAGDCKIRYDVVLRGAVCFDRIFC